MSRNEKFNGINILIISFIVSHIIKNINSYFENDLKSNFQINLKIV